MIKSPTYKDTLKAFREHSKNQIDEKYYHFLKENKHNELLELVEDRAVFWGYDKIDGYFAFSECGKFKYIDNETFDDEGKLIPLSERFDWEKDDPRY